jgi:hypothetical protein
MQLGGAATAEVAASMLSPGTETNAAALVASRLNEYRVVIFASLGVPPEHEAHAIWFLALSRSLLHFH